ncbi:hypothetical protein K438DRAFT_1979982 [Mycena galopus ATCC 62051]|nr:hypothetical protein K438DRAFT_1979982 [Mycena galopus ATCC 62051]
MSKYLNVLGSKTWKAQAGTGKGTSRRLSLCGRLSHSDSSTNIDHISLSVSASLITRALVEKRRSFADTVSPWFLETIISDLEWLRHWLGVPQILSPQVVHTLHLHAPREITPLIAGFGYARFPRLVVLSLAPHNPSDVDGFISILKECPRLESLATPQLEYTLVPFLLNHGIHPDTIPLLRDLSGRPEVFFPFLASNRRITAAAVLMAFRGIDLEGLAYLPGDALRAFNDMRNSCAALLSLSIREIPLNRAFGSHRGVVSAAAEADELSSNAQATSNHGYPIVRDADAFHNVSEEALSDGAPPIELVQAQSTQEIPTFSELHMIYNWITSGNASLPSDIEVLRVRQDGPCSFLYLDVGHATCCDCEPQPALSAAT